MSVSSISRTLHVVFHSVNYLYVVFVSVVCICDCIFALCLCAICHWDTFSPVSVLLLCFGSMPAARLHYVYALLCVYAVHTVSLLVCLCACIL